MSQLMDLLKQAIASGGNFGDSLKSQNIQIATTPQEQAQGLRNQPPGTSMVFPDSKGSFNTKGMKFNLDIQKYDNDGHLVQSYRNVPPGIENLPMGNHEGTVIETPADYQDGGQIDDEYLQVPQDYNLDEEQMKEYSDDYEILTRNKAISEKYNNKQISSAIGNKKEMQEMFGFDALTGDVKDDIEAIRKISYQDGLYDQARGKFTDAHFDYVKRKYASNGKMKRLLSKFKGKDIVWLMNNLATKGGLTSRMRKNPLELKRQQQQQRFQTGGFEDIETPAIQKFTPAQEILGPYKLPEWTGYMKHLSNMGVEFNDFNDWYNWLPDTLKTEHLDDKFNLQQAYKGRLGPSLDDEGNWSLGYKNQMTGQLLRYEDHPQFYSMVEEETQMNNKIYRNNLGQLYSYAPDQEVPAGMEPYTPFTEKTFMAYMKDVENDDKVGYNPKTKLWYPHSSFEGGARTIGYGHKLRKGDYKVYKKGLTDAQVEKLLKDDIRDAYSRMDDRWGNQQWYQNLTDREKGALADFEFNVKGAWYDVGKNTLYSGKFNKKTEHLREWRRGAERFPTFLSGLQLKDGPVKSRNIILEEYKRSKSLDRRNKKFKSFFIDNIVNMSKYNPGMDYYKTGGVIKYQSEGELQDPLGLNPEVSYAPDYNPADDPTNIYNSNIPAIPANMTDVDGNEEALVTSPTETETISKLPPINMQEFIGPLPEDQQHARQQNKYVTDKYIKDKVFDITKDVGPYDYMFPMYDVSYAPGYDPSEGPQDYADLAQQHQQNIDDTIASEQAVLKDTNKNLIKYQLEIHDVHDRNRQTNIEIAEVNAHKEEAKQLLGNYWGKWRIKDETTGEMKWNPNYNKEDVKILQEMLKDNGYDLGKFKNPWTGEYDGVDGLFGNVTKRAYEKYMNDKLRTKQSMRLDFEELQDQECSATGECAENAKWMYQSRGVDPYKVGTNGHAWQWANNINNNGGTTYFNVYDKIVWDEGDRPTTISEQKTKTQKAIQQHGLDVIAPKINEQERDWSAFNEGDAVGLYFPFSNSHEQARVEGDGTFNTHVGVITGFNEDGVPIVSHNSKWTHGLTALDVDNPVNRQEGLSAYSDKFQQGEFPKGNVYHQTLDNMFIDNGQGQQLPVQLVWASTPDLSGAKKNSGKYNYDVPIIEHPEIAKNTIEFYKQKNGVNWVNNIGEKHITDMINFTYTHAPIIAQQLGVNIDIQRLAETALGIMAHESGFGTNVESLPSFMHIFNDPDVTPDMVNKIMLSDDMDNEQIDAYAKKMKWDRDVVARIKKAKNNLKGGKWDDEIARSQISMGIAQMKLGSINGTDADFFNYNVTNADHFHNGGAAVLMSQLVKNYSAIEKHLTSNTEVFNKEKGTELTSNDIWDLTVGGWNAGYSRSLNFGANHKNKTVEEQISHLREVQSFGMFHNEVNGTGYGYIYDLPGLNTILDYHKPGNDVKHQQSFMQKYLNPANPNNPLTLPGAAGHIIGKTFWNKFQEDYPDGVEHYPSRINRYVHKIVENPADYARLYKNEEEIKLARKELDKIPTETNHDLMIKRDLDAQFKDELMASQIEAEEVASNIPRKKSNKKPKTSKRTGKYVSLFKRNLTNPES